MGNSFTKPLAVDTSVGRLAKLSRDIERNTRLLTDRLQAQGQEAPSFNVGGLAEFPLEDNDTEAATAREDLMVQTKELHDLIQGPRETLKNFAWGSINYISLFAVHEFKIAEAVPRIGQISYQDLTREIHRLTGLKLLVPDVRRLMRLAIVNMIFQEPQVEYVAHNRTSLLLLEDENLASWVGMFTTDLLGPIVNTVPAIKKWQGSEEPNETGVNFTFEHSLGFFDHLQVDDDRAKRYDRAMRDQSTREGYDASHTVESYPWVKFGSGLIVDVGGNHGLISCAIANANPSLSFVVQDLPGMRTPAIVGSVPPQLAQRVSLTTHDFFEPQPIFAKAYFFRHIFHAFVDKQAVEILRALIPALRPGARIIINDLVMPAPGTLPRREEKDLRMMDVLMQTVCNARERAVEDWKVLFEKADTRFKWRGAWKTSGKLWFMEAVWED